MYIPGSNFSLNQSSASQSLFGNRTSPNTGLSEFHGGVDWIAPLGTIVPAASYGTVVYSGYNALYGNTVIVDCGGYYTLYAHLSSINAAAAKDKIIGQGQSIGQVGGTGSGANGRVHLHFEILTGNAPVISAAGGPMGVWSSNQQYHINPLTFTAWNGSGPYQGVPSTGTGMCIPGQTTNDPNATYCKVYNSNGSVQLYYTNSVIYTYTNNYQQWSVPDGSGGTTIYTRDVLNPATPNASFGDWVTQHITSANVVDANGMVASPKAKVAISSAMVNPFLDPATAQAFALAEATGSGYPSKAKGTGVELFLKEAKRNRLEYLWGTAQPDLACAG